MNHWCFVIIALICLGGCKNPKKLDETSTGKAIGGEMVDDVAVGGMDAIGGNGWTSKHNDKIAVAEPDRVIVKVVEDVIDTNETAVDASKAMPDEMKDNMVTTDSGLQIETLIEGDGATPQRGDTAVVHYTGWLMNGTKFDSSVDRGTPFTFPLGQGRVIKGWDEGVALMRIGQKVKLTIPPELGYGARGAGGVIPGNATLIFEVELIEIR